MTFPDRRLERPLEARFENTQDVLPPTERNQDPERSMRGLVNEAARPLSEDERKMADRDSGTAGERVYAPASERVPKTVASYGDVVNNPDTATPERQAVSTPAADTTWPTATEPSFTRVARPSNPGETTGTTDGTDYASDTGSDSNTNRWMSNVSSGPILPIGMGWLGFSICAGVGVWLWMRWQRERNKPINRLRRQARQAAALARARMPEVPEMPEEATRPAIGIGTALLSVAILLWQQSQSRSRAEQVRGRAQKGAKRANRFGRRAADSIPEVDWQQRLAHLRDFWNPSRIELEKISIPRR
jgi:hypothetical protein